MFQNFSFRLPSWDEFWGLFFKPRTVDQAVVGLTRASDRIKAVSDAQSARAASHAKRALRETEKHKTASAEADRANRVHSKLGDLLA